METNGYSNKPLIRPAISGGHGKPTRKDLAGRFVVVFVASTRFRLLHHISAPLLQLAAIFAQQCRWADDKFDRWEKIHHVTTMRGTCIISTLLQ